MDILIGYYYNFLKCNKYHKDLLYDKGHLVTNRENNIADLFQGIYFFIYRKVFKENNYNSKLLYGIIKEIRKYICKPSNIKLNIIKDLLSRVTLFSYDYDFYSNFYEVLTRCHCDLNLFEATKFFIFRLYQAGFYFEEDNPDYNRLFIFNKKGQYNREFAHP